MVCSTVIWRHYDCQVLVLDHPRNVAGIVNHVELIHLVRCAPAAAAAGRHAASRQWQYDVSPRASVAYSRVDAMPMCTLQLLQAIAVVPCRPALCLQLFSAANFWPASH